MKEGQELHLSAFAEASPTTLYVIGIADWEKQEPYVAFHDGSTWSRIPTPFAGRIEQQQVDPDYFSGSGPPRGSSGTTTPQRRSGRASRSRT